MICAVTIFNELFVLRKLPAGLRPPLPHCAVIQSLIGCVKLLSCIDIFVTCCLVNQIEDKLVIPPLSFFASPKYTHFLFSCVLFFSFPFLSSCFHSSFHLYLYFLSICFLYSLFSISLFFFVSLFLPSNFFTSPFLPSPPLHLFPPPLVLSTLFFYYLTSIFFHPPTC